MRPASRHFSLQIDHRQKIKERALKMVFKALYSRVLAVVFVVAGGGAVAAPVTLTESFGFDNNQLPSGWDYVYFSAPRNNIYIANNQLNIGQVDTSAGIYRNFNSAGVTKLQVEYDANISNLFFGQGTAVY